MKKLILILTLVFLGSPASASTLFCTPTIKSIKDRQFIFHLKDSASGPPPIPYSLSSAERVRNASENTKSQSWNIADMCEAPANCKQTRYVKTNEFIAETVVIEASAVGRDGPYKNTFHVDLETGVGFILASSEKFQVKSSELYPNGVGQLLIIPFNCSENIPAEIDLPR